MVNSNCWRRCLDHLQNDIPPQQFRTWIRPLQAEEETGFIRLLAPNHFVRDRIEQRYLKQIRDAIRRVSEDDSIQLHLGIGGNDDDHAGEHGETLDAARPRRSGAPTSKQAKQRLGAFNKHFTFATFVEGKTNQLARAASLQVAKNPGLSYNPLFIYGGVGLGKTHLMQAIGHTVHQHNPSTRIAYLHSERFVADMVKALQHNSFNDFKHHYRGLGTLLLDDIQFFSGKERTQEEFFHTFNALLEGQRQIVLTCDRYPKEVDGLEERLKSRFGWGLTVAIDPPELETRVAIVHQKAKQTGIDIPDDVAFFIAERFRSNIRELEGALNRVVATANFSGNPITLETTQYALRDLLLIQDRLVSVDNIQKVVAEYFKLRVADLLSKRRSRSVARPRQIAMAIAKELTNHSLPEIGDQFGGRDHTTVLHACRRIAELKDTEQRLREDYANLTRLLTT